MEFELSKHTHILAIAGSRAYGIHKPDSDVDLKGVAIPPIRYYLGGFSHFEQADKPEHLKAFEGLLSPELQQIVAGSKLEGSVYEFQKFITLAADCNPNILDTVFGRDEDVLLLTALGKKIRDHRELFLSTKAKHTFSGYAMAQLKRIRGHRNWLLNPPKQAPVREDFGLPQNTLIPADHLAAITAAVQKKLDEWTPSLASLSVSDRVAIQGSIQTFLEEFCAGLPEGLVQDEDKVVGATWLAAARTVGVSDNLIWILQKEREWTAAQRGWTQYQTWLKSRNPERAELEAKYKYDTKHGAHLVRLMRMGQEILTTGKVHVWRGPGGGEDAEEIREIRKGSWDYEKLVSWAEAQDSLLNKLYADPAKTAVPKAPDRKALEEFVISTIQEALR